MDRAFVSCRWIRSLLVVSACIGLSVLAAACGDDDSGDGAESSGSGRRAVKIGVIAPLDAGLTRPTGMASRTRSDSQCRRRTPTRPSRAGRSRSPHKNDSSEPAVGKKAAQKLAGEDPAVIGVVGTYNSGVAAETAPVLEKAGIAQISPGNTDPTLTLGSTRRRPERQFDDYFRVVASDAQQGPCWPSTPQRPRRDEGRGGERDESR